MRREICCPDLAGRQVKRSDRSDTNEERNDEHHDRC
jgi:hypothetical protein